MIDASSYKKALARYANDAKGLHRVKGIGNNCIYQVYDGKVYIESVKDIPANSEILVEYGKEYWDVIRYNARLHAKELKENQRAKKKSKKAVR